jgi:hypothetical protein
MSESAPPSPVTPEEWRTACIATAEEILAWLPSDQVQRLARLYASPSALRRRRLAERDDAIRELAALYDASSGRQLADAVHRDLNLVRSSSAKPIRPSAPPAGDDRLAVMRRVLVLCGGKVPSFETIRRALAGIGVGNGRSQV